MECTPKRGGAFVQSERHFFLLQIKGNLGEGIFVFEKGLVDGTTG